MPAKSPTSPLYPQSAGAAADFPEAKERSAPLGRASRPTSAARGDHPPLHELADRVAAFRGVLEGLIAERAVLEDRIASLERAMSERWQGASPIELPANEQRLFVRIRRIVPLGIRKAIVQAYRSWSR